MNGALDSRAPRSAFRARALTALSLLLGLAAVLRLLAWQRTAVMFNDGPIFLALAEALRAGRVDEVLAHPQHPLYPALIAALGEGGGSDVAAAVGISVAGGVAAVAAVFAMVRARFGMAVAWPAAWVVALHPWAVDFSADVMSDGLHAGLYLTGFALLVALLERPAIGSAVAFGLVAGLAFLARPEGLVLAAAAVVLFAVQVVRDADRRRAFVAAAACGLLVCAALVGAYRLGAASGGQGVELTSKKSIGVLARGGPSESERELERARRRESNRRPDALPLPEGSLRVDTPRAPQPARSLAGGLEAVGRVVGTSVSAFRHELTAFALIGLVACGPLARGREGRARSGPLPAYERALVATLVIHTAVLVLLVWGAGYVSRRHALTAWLPLVPFAVMGFQTSFARLFPRPSGGRLALFALIALLVVSFGPRDLRERRMDRALERAAAEWLGEEGRSAGPVAAQKRRTAYYAGRPFVPLPDGRDGLIERQLRARGTRFVVIDAAKLTDHAGLAEGIGDWLEPVHTARAEGQAVLVLELTPGPAR